MEKELLKSLKLRIKNVEDELLLDLIRDAITDVKTHINYAVTDDLPAGCDSLVKELVSIRANQIGNEGLASYSAAGVSETYLADLPADLRCRLNKFRRLP